MLSSKALSSQIHLKNLCPAIIHVDTILRTKNKNQFKQNNMQHAPKEICGIVKCHKLVYKYTTTASREKIESLVGRKLVPLLRTNDQLS